MKKHFESAGTFLRCQIPLPQHWMNFALSRSIFHISTICSLRDNFIRIDLYIEGYKAKKNFHKLKSLYEEDANSHFDNSLEWCELPEATVSIVNMSGKNSQTGSSSNLGMLSSKIRKYFEIVIVDSLALFSTEREF